MSRRERKSEVKALIRRLEEGQARTIKARNIANYLIDMSTELSTDMLHFLDLIGFEGYRVPKAPVSSCSLSSNTAAPDSSLDSSPKYRMVSSSIRSSAFGNNDNSFDVIATWDTWTINTNPYYVPKKSPAPKLLCIVVDRSEKMASSWAAIKESVRAQIAIMKSQGPVLTSITVVDEAVLHLVNFDNAVNSIPKYVRIGAGCAIMDGIAAQIEAAVDYTSTHSKYANNVELLVYTKGIDTASTRIVSMEKLAKVINAAASIGYSIRIMDPSARSMARKLGLSDGRQFVKPAGPATKLLTNLKAHK